MTAYWDTSGLVRAFLLGITPRGVTRSHTAAEFYGTFTGRGVPLPGGTKAKRLAPGEAAAVVRELFSALTLVDLSPAETVQAIVAAADGPQAVGAAIHDWLHCQAAAKAGATRIMTVNPRDFQRMTRIRLEQPSKDAPVQPAA